MPDLRNHGLLLGLIVLVTLVSPAAAFGAGNIASISKISGQNCLPLDSQDRLQFADRCYLDRATWRH